MKEFLRRQETGDRRQGRQETFVGAVTQSASLAARLPRLLFSRFLKNFFIFCGIHRFKTKNAAAMPLRFSVFPVVDISDLKPVSENVAQDLRDARRRVATNIALLLRDDGEKPLQRFIDDIFVDIDRAIAHERQISIATH